MQVPEKLSLIGGSILLASTLVFTLKSQASNILPKVDNGMSELFKSDKDRQVDQQKQDFTKNYQQARQKHWQTGMWGTASFYVDDQGNMHVGSGQLQGSFSNVANDQQIKTISFDEDAQAPQDSSFLFADNDYGSIPLTQINGLNYLDTSQTTNMSYIFNEDSSLSDLDVNYFDTRNVTIMYSMFGGDSSLSNLDLSHFDTHNVTDMFGMFEGDTSLNNLDLSHFDTSNVNNMEHMFVSDSIHKLTLGPDSRLNSNNIPELDGIYKDGSQALSANQIMDSDSHSGTWIKQ